MSNRKLFSLLLFLLLCNQATKPVVPVLSNQEYRENVCYGLYNDPYCQSGDKCYCGLSVRYKNQPSTVDVSMNKEFFIGDGSQIFCKIRETDPCFKHVYQSTLYSYVQSGIEEGVETDGVIKMRGPVFLKDEAGEEFILGSFLLNNDDEMTSVFTKHYLLQKSAEDATNELSIFLSNHNNLIKQIGYLYCQAPITINEDNSIDYTQSDSERILSLICLVKVYAASADVSPEFCFYDVQGDSFYVIQMRLDIDCMPIKCFGVSDSDDFIVLNFPKAILPSFYIDESKLETDERIVKFSASAEFLETFKDVSEKGQNLLLFKPEDLEKDEYLVVNPQSPEQRMLVKYPN